MFIGQDSDFEDVVQVIRLCSFTFMKIKLLEAFRIVLMHI